MSMSQKDILMSAAQVSLRERLGLRNNYFICQLFASKNIVLSSGNWKSLEVNSNYKCEHVQSIETFSWKNEYFMNNPSLGKSIL